MATLPSIKDLEMVILATVAGLLGYLMRMVKKGEKIHPSYAMLEAASSGFVGYLIFLLCRAMKVNDQWVGPLVGICGWMGASSSIVLIQNIVAKRLGADQLPEVKDALASTGTGSSERTSKEG
jgi:hypothetical protein